MALERCPEVTAAFVELGHEIACHGWRWIHYQNVDEATEREHMQRGMEIIQALTGERPLGWYTGRDSPNTRRLVADHGGFEYDSDYYGDDLPFWLQVRRSDGALAPHLVVPYTLDCNDMRFALPQGYSHGDEFFAYLRDAFDVHYAEGAERPAMMSIGMHCRLLGRPGRMRALQRFLDHVQRTTASGSRRRIDIARHWRRCTPSTPPPPSLGMSGTTMMLTLDTAQPRRPRRLHRAARRHLRTLALDRRARLAKRPGLHPPGRS
jgi:allantoinase